MSVRRLADAPHQPPAFAFSRSNAAWAKQTIAKYPKGRQQSAVIPLLMRAQEQDGWVTKAAIEHVADMLEMPYIRALEVATFYTQFQLKPVGTRAHVQVCGTTPCMLRGSEELIALCKKRIHPEQLHPNADGTLSWEEVECQGACVNAPMVMIFKDAYEDLTPERLAEIIDAFEAGRGDTVKPGPQIDRIYSAPATGLTSLTDERVVTRPDPEPKRAGRNAPATGEAAAAPTLAGRPKTDAPETNPAIKSPSKVKVDPATEQRESAPAPAHDARAADTTAPETEKSARLRAHSRGKDNEPVNDAPPAALMNKGAAAEPASRPSLDSADRPKGIERPAKPDDLQLISGVGPKIEGILHSLGIYTYSQIAAWQKPERDWVDGYLRFHGRIERENWVAQADALARGGPDEYVRVFGKKPR